MVLSDLNFILSQCIWKYTKVASDFIKEKIKDRPVDKKKVAKRIGMTVLIAVIFGVVSAFTFTFVYARISPDKRNAIKEVSLSGSEPEADTAGTPSDDAADISLSDDDTVSQNDTPEPEPADTEVSRPSSIINNITNNVDMTPESYQKLCHSVHDVAENAARSLVIINATTTDTDWFENPYQNGSTSTGLIIADNGRQLLVLTDSSATKGAEQISVVFPDGTDAEAEVINTDSDTSLQIIAVELSDISDETMKRIQYASLGSSTYSSTVGTPVVAIGAPIGILPSEAYGFITSMSQEKEMSDFNVHLLTTDIQGSENASGVIIDYSGKVLGIITTAYKDSNIEKMITTFSISDIKDIIENLANGKERTYMGIIGTSVTRDAADAYNMPVGAYVINVDPDSPAMAAGIQSGDVITKIGTESVTDYNDYSRIISELTAGVDTVVTVQRYSRGSYTELTFEAELSKK